MLRRVIALVTLGVALLAMAPAADAQLLGDHDADEKAA